MIFLVSGVFIARGKEDALVTKNMVPGESVYGEKKIAVEVNWDHETIEKTMYCFEITFDQDLTFP